MLKNLYNSKSLTGANWANIYTTKNEIMKVEIWSDIICPFCYIGKRKFESALQDFGSKETVEIVWRSFQLDPQLKHLPQQSVHEYLAVRKGVSTAEGKAMNDTMTAAARDVGLLYDLDHAVVNNTLNAHRLSHLAGKFGLQNEIEEALFAAYFIKGQDVGEYKVLIEIGKDAGLKEADIKKMYETDEFVEEVEADMERAKILGVQGVPFYVFNNKYTVSGAQSVTVFKEALQQISNEEKLLQRDAPEGFCTPEGICK